MKQAEGQGMCCSTGHGLKLTKVTQIRSAIECIVSMRIYSVTSVDQIQHKDYIHIKIRKYCLV